MDSSTNRRQTEEQKQAELRRQIAALQSQLKDESTVADDVSVTPKKRKQNEHSLLAPATPSPKKRKRMESTVPFPARPHVDTLSKKESGKHADTRKEQHPYTLNTSQPSAPSTMLAKLASLNSNPTTEDYEYAQSRTSGFSERAPTVTTGEADRSNNQVSRRDDLTIIEDLEPGPYDHKPPFDDPHFQRLEPHSSIRLSSRSIPYDEFQDYLRGRFYLSPSRLYSVIRLLPSKQGYDVPVEGDWVTIAVIAERGPVRYSKAPVGVGKENSDGAPEDDVKSLTLDASAKPTPPPYQRWKGKAKEEPTKPSGKRYVNLKLIDFGCRSKSSATAEKALIRGDAFLSLLLFECDSVEEITREDGKKEKLYKGGSRGAFERMAKLKEGAVVALLNPKILRPFQRAGDKPHPTDNILALTPESIDSVAIIGHSQDLGMCTVVKRDGKACGGWCDKRVSDVCEWHIQHAVQQKRAGRAEFSAGTSGMANAAKRKPAYDPSRQWGLKPEPERGGGAGDATYIVSGHIVSNGAGKQSLFISENVGRDAQAKAARKASAKDADIALQNLLKRDKEGMKAVVAARAYSKKMAEKQSQEKAESKKTKSIGAKATGLSAKSKARESLADGGDTDAVLHSRSAYSVSLVRNLGFDPTGKDGRKSTTKDVQNKLQTLASIQASRKDIRLGPRPGKLKSTVRVPEHIAVEAESRHKANFVDEELTFPSDVSNDELDEKIGTSGKYPQSNSESMVNLDSSDVELEVEPSS